MANDVAIMLRLYVVLAMVSAATALAAGSGPCEDVPYQWRRTLWHPFAGENYCLNASGDELSCEEACAEAMAIRLAIREAREQGKPYFLPSFFC